MKIVQVARICSTTGGDNIKDYEFRLLARTADAYANIDAKANAYPCHE